MTTPARRMAIDEVAPRAWGAMLRLNAEAARSGPDHGLLELVKVRVSQVNGCAFCLDMHVLDARALGVEQVKLDLVAVWREAHVFDDRERAGLALAEAMTALGGEGVPDDVYAAAEAAFPDPEHLAGLVWSITVINAWNRIAIATGMEPGHHRPGS